MKSNRLIEYFHNFFEKNGWNFEDSKQITRGDLNLLFQISGGSVLEKELSGISDSKYERIASFQNCLRTDTWEKIGYSGRHHLVFGMIGHFMFFEKDELSTKKIMIETALKFLVDCLNIQLTKLAVSINPTDDISFAVWQSLGIENIRENPKNVSVDPFDMRYGTRTEIISLGPSGTECELWNIVFHSNSYKEDGKNHKISADSGASIDRLIRARDQKDNDYETAYWCEFISLISDNSATKIRLAEMLKASVFLLNENLSPSNKGAPYVLRKIIRESYNLSETSESCLSDYTTAERYWLDSNISKVNIFKLEVDAYQLALRKGEKELLKILDRKGKLDENDFIFLSDSFGYPKTLAIKKVGIYEK